jgi:hypothetical protein
MDADTDVLVCDVDGGCETVVVVNESTGVAWANATMALR